jgi:hypothetical protein
MTRGQKLVVAVGWVLALCSAAYAAVVLWGPQ